jgi:hypothetical protein
MLCTYLFSLIIISGFFGNRVKSLDKDLVKQKEDYEKKITSLSAHFNKELLKLKFELNNKQKYAVGDKLLDNSITVLDFCIAESDPYVSDTFRVYSNRYEVFDSNKNTKIFIFEKDLEELIKKATV